MNKGILVMIGGVALFVAGFLLLGQSGFGVLLMLLGIGALIVGSVLLMGSSGRIKSDYFDNGTNYCTDQPTQKEDLPPVSDRTGENQE